MMASRCDLNLTAISLTMRQLRLEHRQLPSELQHAEAHLVREQLLEPLKLWALHLLHHHAKLQREHRRA